MSTLRTGQLLGLGSWALLFAWVILMVTGNEQAGGWCLLAAGLLLFVAGALFRRSEDRQVALTGAIMLGAGLFFVVLGLVFAL